MSSIQVVKRWSLWDSIAWWFGSVTPERATRRLAEEQRTKHTTKQIKKRFLKYVNKRIQKEFTTKYIRIRTPYHLYYSYYSTDQYLIVRDTIIEWLKEIGYMVVETNSEYSSDFVYISLDKALEDPKDKIL